MRIIYLLVAFCYLCLNLDINAYAKVIIYNQDYYNVTEVEILEDKTNFLNIKDITTKYRDKFIYNKNKSPNLGFSKFTYWLKFDLENKSINNDWYLEVAFPRLNEVSLFIPDKNNFIVKRSGVKYKDSEKEIKSRKIVFQLPKFESNSLYLKVYSPKSALQVPIKIVKKNKFWQDAVNEEVFYSVCYGILLIMAFYNLIIFMILKENSYLFYCIFTFGTMMSQISINGHGHYYLWPDYPEFELVAPWLFKGILGLGFTLFLRSFLVLDKQGKFYKTLKFIIVFSLINLLITLVHINPTYNFFATSINTLCLCILVLAYYILLPNKENYLKLLIFGWIAMCIGGIIFMISRFGFINKSFFTDNIFLISMCITNISISIALAEKFKIYKEEKKKYYDQLEKANNQLSDYKDNLEKLVKEKTFELEKAKIQAEKMSQLKSNFLAVMSHDIRTPINSVIGMTELLSLTTMNNEQNYFVKTIMSSSEVLLSLINDILDLSKMESGKMEFERKEFVLKECLDQVMYILESNAYQKNLKLSYSINQDIPERIISDANKLKRILINLVGNSIKFTHQGEISINLQLNYKDEKECEILFAVKDTGIGIPEDKRNKIFQPFSQADLSISQEFGGTGLGLNISKNIAEAMDGQMYFENNKDSSGTTFYFSIKTQYLDLKENKSIENDLEQKYIPDNDLFLKYPLHILVAEDNQINQKLIKKVFEKLGYQIDIVNNGREAIEICSENFYDLVFMDIQMPEVDGVEATKVIKGRLREKSPIIFALTANVLEEQKEVCIKAGMTGFLTKPFRINDIESLVISLGNK